MRQDDMEDVYEAYAPVVYKYLLSLTHDPALAEDLTADTFEQALRHIDRFRGDSRLSTWLCTIGKRLWYKKLKKRGGITFLPLDGEPLVSPQDVERDVIGHEDKLDFYRRIHALDEDTREVFYLRLNGDMTFDEIGEILGRSGPWARVKFYRGKEKLKERMKRDDE